MVTSITLPWLATTARGESTVGSLVRYGYQKLVDAAVHTGVARTGAMGLALDAAKLGSALGGFWHRLRVPLLGVKGESTDYVEALGRLIGGEFDPIARQLPLWENAERQRLHVLGLASLHRASRGLMQRPFDAETAKALIDRLERVGWSYWGKALPELDAWVRYPQPLPWQAGTLACACLSALHGQAPEAGLTTLDVAALALLGATLQQVSMTRRCTACFRWAEPGRLTCAVHAPMDLGTEAEDPQRAIKLARAQRLAQRLYGATDSVAPMHGRSVGMVFWLSRTLWSTPVEHEDVIVDELLRRAAQSPDLLDTMHTTSERLRREFLLVRLERHIDPLELRPAAWLDGIELANAWRHWELWGRLPQSAGRTLRTNLLIQRGIEAAQRGHDGRNQVAREIGVHPTLISHWLRRGGDDPAIRQLADALGRRRRVPNVEPQEVTPEVDPSDVDRGVTQSEHRAMMELAKGVARMLEGLRAQGIIDPEVYRLRKRPVVGPSQGGKR